jgi:hypothetical protein
MKSTFTFILLLSFFTIQTANSCKSGGKCDLALNVNQSEVVVAFKQASTGKYLYSEFNPTYNKDSLKVFDPEGNSLIILSSLNQIPNTSSRYWELSFGNIYNTATDGAAFDSYVCKNYLIKYSYKETDTIKVCFKARRTKCGSVFDPLEVYYKSSIVGSATNTTGILVSINKN